MSVNKVLDKTDTNMLVQHKDGSVENVSLSPLNRLLFDHGLWGVLRDGSEILQLDGEDRGVTLIPGEDAREYTMEVDETEPLHIGEHQKSELVDALMDCYGNDGERNPAPLLRLYDRLRANVVRQRVVNYIGESAALGNSIEMRDDGWLINGHLLLTWDNEFIHPGTTSRTVSGSAVRAGSSEPAYQMSLSHVGNENRTITADGETYRLTDAEMEFVARSLWAIKQAPNNQTGGR